MRVGWEALSKGPMAVCCLFLALQPGLAQNTSRKPVAESPGTARAMLAGKAQVLDSRGRPDMAIQLWQQILLSDPNNVEALAGLARDLKLTGSDKAPEVLARLRKVSPNDPNIAKIEAMGSTRAESDQLRHAGELARQGKAADAMRIYRQLYGDRPPDGDIALAYYQTLFATAGGKQEAINGMRAAAARNPGDARYGVELGTMLANNEKTHSEGIRMLEEHPRDLNAQAALRQDVLRDSANPVYAPEVREYLKEHPEDAEIASRLKTESSSQPKKDEEPSRPQPSPGIGRATPEQAAYEALKEHHLGEAEKRFMAILDKEPNDGRAAAGMGLVRMQERNFGDAINFLTQAESDGFKGRAVEDALANSQFSFTMGLAAQALNENQLDLAAAKYREALAMRPHSPQVLDGLAGLLLREKQYTQAAALYDQLVEVQPNSTDGWRGLFLAYAQDRQNDEALAVEARLPTSVKDALTRDPEYLRELAAIYLSENRTAEAQRTLAEALALPFPGNGSALNAETKLEYAGILMEAKRYSQAAALYERILGDDRGDLSAWMGMVSAHHEMGEDALAIDDVQKMPPAAYEAALGDPSFVSTLAAAYRQANQLDVAQGMLERAVKLQIASAGEPGAELELQLAGIYLQRNDVAHAYEIYHQVLDRVPDSTGAWKGLIAALLAGGRSTEAAQVIAVIPARVRKGLDVDIAFLETEASAYAATGDVARAAECMDRVLAHYASLHTEPPAAVEIQNASLLLETQNDRALYAALMRLGGRTDLTVAQRDTVEDIWADWSVRRAEAAMDSGNAQRSLDILDAASQAFPDNLTVSKAVAEGYERVGRAKESLAIYKTIPMQDATPGDFQGAIGAALAANDRSQAEAWLRQALERFQRDPAILMTAARFEQARRDNQRAAAYYRAALANMPSASPTEKLAQVLVYPEQDTGARRVVTTTELQRLLNPDFEQSPGAAQPSSLPAYVPDRNKGSKLAAPAPSSAQKTSAPLAPGQRQSPPAPVYVPQSWTRPRTETASQQLRHSQDAVAAPKRNSRRGRNTYNLPHLMYATLSENPGSRAHRNAWSTGNAYLRTASFAGKILSPAHAAPTMREGSLAAPRTAPNGGSRQVELSANPPHSQASDAWKKLVFSLMASKRNAKALQELRKIPPSVRRQLEADVEFAKAEARLYRAVGDLPHAAYYRDRVEKFYALHRAGAQLAEQSATKSADMQAATSKAQTGNQVRTASGSAPSAASLSPYSGKMHVPPAEETVDSTAPVTGNAVAQSAPPPVWTPGNSTGAPNPSPALRITSEPLGPLAAQAQALFADQTDSQLTQGSASAIHNGANAPAVPLPGTSNTSRYNVAQYAPSAQQAATGAYSAPKQQQQQPVPPPGNPPAAQQCVPHLCPPIPAKPSAAHRRTARKKATPPAPQAIQPSQPTLAQAPAEANSHANEAPQPVQAPAEVRAPAPAPAPTTDTGLSDEQLQERNLPPLRGPWIRNQRQGNPWSPRDEAEMQLRSIESGYSPWFAGTGVINFRPGDAGYDHLAAMEAPFEISMPMGLNARLSIVGKPVFLDSGQANGASVITVQETTAAGNSLVSIPQPIGTLTATATTLPAQQNAVGVGGEVQLAFPQFAVAAGYMPEGFLITTLTGRAMWKPGNGPVTLSFSREPVRDSQLSYAGLRDPNGGAPGTLGQIWGSVMANQGNVQFAHGDAGSGFYLGVGGQYLAGHSVEINNRMDGDAGAYWQLKVFPEYGNLSIGANFFGMHYEHNENAYTHGMGGYFSPQSYFLANVPFTWVGHYGTHWHYNVLGSLGVQAFQEDLTPLWPLAVDKALETALNDAMLPARTSVDANYDLRSQVSYQIGPHWFAGGFVSSNNSRNYPTVSAGFSVHYMFRTQPSTATTPTGIFPIEGLRPFTVP